MSEPVQETEQVVETPRVSLPGARLRATREAGRMSREEVAQHLHLDAQIVTALEQDNYDKLPSPMYVCGYLRSYARLLKLPETEIVGAYTQGKEINAAIIPENVNILPGKKPFNPAILKTVALFILALGIIAGLVWVTEETNFFSVAPPSDKQVQLPIAVPENVPAQADASAAATENQESSLIQELPAPTAQEIEQKIAQTENQETQQSAPVVVENNVASGAGDLRLVVKQDSWVEVTDSESVRQIYRLARAGTELNIAGKAPYKILLGNASGVDVYYKDKLFDHSRFHRDEVAYFKIGVAE
jgi:cytoskeleton protein RodZ